MEGSRSMILWELNSISDLVFLQTIMEFCSSISKNPLFSSIVTLYALTLLYFPYHFLRIVFSPVLIITGILLLAILRLGAIQKFEIEEENHGSKENRGSTCTQSSNEVEEQITSLQEDEDHGFFSYESESEMGFDYNPCFEELFVEWNLKAPLEVIYEEDEGEEDEMDPNKKDQILNEKGETQVMGLERYPSLSLYYPESDSDSSSDGGFSGTGVWGSPETMCFRWDEEDREGLIEIALDGNSKRGSGSQADHEEDNLIEIDISPTRNNEFCREEWQFSGNVRFS